MADSSWNTDAYRRFKKDIDSDKINKSFDLLKEELSLKTHRMSHGKLIEAIDNAADYYFRASELFLIAENEYRTYKLFYEIEMSNLSFAARKELEEKKKNKELGSQITADLIRSWVIKEHKKEFRKLEKVKRQLKMVTIRFLSLRDSWRQRMSLLQSQARAIDSKRQVRLGEGEAGDKFKD